MNASTWNALHGEICKIMHLMHISHDFKYTKEKVVQSMKSS